MGIISFKQDTHMANIYREDVLRETIVRNHYVPNGVAQLQNLKHQIVSNR